MFENNYRKIFNSEVQWYKLHLQMGMNMAPNVGLHYQNFSILVRHLFKPRFLFEFEFPCGANIIWALSANIQYFVSSFVSLVYSSVLCNGESSSRSLPFSSALVTATLISVWKIGEVDEVG